MGEALENQKYSEEEALAEAERLTNIVKAGDGTMSYSDAERLMKTINREVRPFDEKKFDEFDSILNMLIGTPNFNDADAYNDIAREGRRDSYRREKLPKILDSKDIFLRAYDYKNDRLAGDIEEIMRSNADGGEDEGNKYVHKLKEFAANLVTELTPKIVEDLHKERISKRWIWTLDSLVLHGDEKTRKAGIDALTGVIGILEKGRNVEIIESILLNGNETQTQNASESLKRLSEEIKDASELSRLASCFFKREANLELMAEGQKVLQSILERHNLPFEITYSWVISGWNSADAVRENLKSIIELESKKPGAAKFLYKEFGIADFGRYPVDLLLKQYEEADNIKNPYGVVIFPRNDWNGAFYETGRKLKSLLVGLENHNFSLRVFECEGKFGVARALLKLNKKYNPPDGSGHKISLAIIGGHGTENSIQFGGKGESNSLYLEDLTGKGAQKTNKFFEENPTIILVSCSTGVDKGIGQKLSKVLGARVIAPMVPTNVNEFRVSKRLDIKPRFNVIYNKDDAKSVFVGGEKKGIN